MDNKHGKTLTQLQRLQAFVKYLGIRGNAFAKAIGVSQPMVSDLLTGKKQLSRQVIEKIALRYSELNVEWLLFGEGEMTKEEKSTLEEPNIEYLGTLRRSYTLHELDQIVDQMKSDIEQMRLEIAEIKRAINPD